VPVVIGYLPMYLLNVACVLRMPDAVEFAFNRKFVVEALDDSLDGVFD